MKQAGADSRSANPISAPRCLAEAGDTVKPVPHETFTLKRVRCAERPPELSGKPHLHLIITILPVTLRFPAVSLLKYTPDEHCAPAPFRPSQLTS